MANVTFDEICDQVASMLGADALDDLPDIDAKRVQIFVNQAYRECYAPIDGKRPRWATKKFTLVFPEGTQSMDMDTTIIDVERYPELVGHGPLSSFQTREDELIARSHYSGDFRTVGSYRGSFPSINMDEPERDRPLWYFEDQTDEGTDVDVVPRMVLYPIPDKEYTVNFTANVMPAELELGEYPRLPADVCWDILLPFAQHKLLVDPRYNGDNKVNIEKAVVEARMKLSRLLTPQKQKNLRLVKRGGW